MNPLIQRAASLKGVVKQLRAQGLIRAMSSGAEYSQLIKPLGERPLIISGHPGDEILALGGTMVWYAHHKKPMTVLTVTAGARGTNTGRLSKPLVAKRKKEQAAAFKIVGGQIHSVNWGLDEKFIPNIDLILKLVETVDEIHPDIIYLPSLLDTHPDSQTIGALVRELLTRMPSPRLKSLWIAQYELWTPIILNKIFNIDGGLKLKTRAIECHESQLLCRDYLSAMLGLNRYRAAMLGAGSSAEGYFICRAEQYAAFAGESSTPVVAMTNR